MTQRNSEAICRAVKEVLNTLQDFGKQEDFERWLGASLEILKEVMDTDEYKKLEELKNPTLECGTSFPWEQRMSSAKQKFNVMRLQNCG